jgi:hypothetical protein
LQPLGAAAAVVQVTDINDGRYSHIYQSAMSLLVIDFTYLEGRDELVVKEGAAVDSHGNRVSSYVFNRPCGWEEVPMFNARMNQAIDNGCNCNDGDVPYAELETVLHREASSTVAIYCFGPQKTEFISGLIDHTVIDITQLRCSQLADINLPAISCTFACHNKSKHFCSLQTAYSLAQWLIFYTLSMQYANCPPQPAYH